MNKILICGGHPTPALSVIDELKKNHPEMSLVFVGRKYAIESERTLSYEYKGCMERRIAFRELQAGRIRCRKILRRGADQVDRAKLPRAPSVQRLDGTNMPECHRTR